MGYYSDLEIESQEEEADRPLPKADTELTPRRNQRGRVRESYEAPNHWVLKKSHTAALIVGLPLAWVNGALVGILLALELGWSK